MFQVGFKGKKGGGRGGGQGVAQGGARGPRGGTREGGGGGPSENSRRPWGHQRWGKAAESLCLVGNGKGHSGGSPLFPPA